MRAKESRDEAKVMPSMDDNMAVNAKASLEEQVHQVIGLQSFDGSWQDSEQLALLLDLRGKEVQIKALFSDIGDLPASVNLWMVMVTTCAVAWFETAAKAEEEVWEMVVEKAKGWIGSKIGEQRAEEYITKVKQLA